MKLTDHYLTRDLQLLKSWGMEMLEGYHAQQREPTWKDQKKLSL